MFSCVYMLTQLHVYINKHSELTSGQAQDEDLELIAESLKKLNDLLGHHMTGSQQARKRFEAMLG